MRISWSPGRRQQEPVQTAVVARPRDSAIPWGAALDDVPVLEGRTAGARVRDGQAREARRSRVGSSSDNDTARRLPKERPADERIDRSFADLPIQAPQPHCLGSRQPQARHLQEFTANTREKWFELHRDLFSKTRAFFKAAGDVRRFVRILGPSYPAATSDYRANPTKKNGNRGIQT